MKYFTNLKTVTANYYKKHIIGKNTCGLNTQKQLNIQNY